MSSLYQYFSGNSIQCPECNSAISCKSQHTNILVCPTCSTVLERFEAEGVVRKKKFKSPPVQLSSFLAPGARGRHNGKNFEITGVIHCNMGSYYHHRCTIMMDDGSLALLTESLGFYAIQQKIEVDYPGKLRQVNGMETGTETAELIKGSKMFAVDKAKCEACFFSGEVLLAGAEDNFKAVELVDVANRRIEIIEDDRGQYEVYEITYVLLDELSLTGGPLQKVQEVTYPCGNCHKPVVLSAPQYAQICVCPSCHTVNKHLKGAGLLSLNNKLKPYTPDIPLGTKGVLKGQQVEVVGAMKKYESGSVATTWTEYVLFNEKRGFAFLAEYNGHFSLLREEKPGLGYPQYQKELFTENENFVLFNEYTFSVESAAGEFFIPFGNGTVKAREFISPPEMYAVENNDGREITWYKGVHVSAEELQQGFGLPGNTLPPAHGIGPLQPMKGYINQQLLGKIALIALALFFAVQTFFSAIAENKEVFSDSFALPVSDSIPYQPIITPSFTVNPASSNIEILLSAAVSNSWFSADITLINEKTGKEFSAEKGLEYYYGYSEGENWTEGSTNSSVLFSSVPKGTYHLNIFPAAGGEKKVDSFFVSVKNDVPMWRNFFILLALVALFPLVQWGRFQLFERQRWNNSPYNPYLKES